MRRRQVWNITLIGFAECVERVQLDINPFWLNWGYGARDVWWNSRQCKWTADANFVARWRRLLLQQDWWHSKHVHLHSRDNKKKSLSTFSIWCRHRTNNEKHLKRFETIALPHFIQHFAGTADPKTFVGKRKRNERKGMEQKRKKNENK